MLTPFGKTLRKLRIDKGMLIVDMADGLSATGANVSISYLSSIEHGRRSIPEGFEERIITLLNLGEPEAKEVRSAAARSRGSIPLPVGDQVHYEVADALARRFNELSPEELEQIREVVTKRR